MTNSCTGPCTLYMLFMYLIQVEVVEAVATEAEPVPSSSSHSESQPKKTVERKPKRKSNDVLWGEYLTQVTIKLKVEERVLLLKYDNA